MAASYSGYVGAACFLCCLATVLSQAGFAGDTTVCQPLVPGPNDKARPSFPNFFDTHIEANILNHNFTADFHLYVDKTGNRLTVFVDNAGIKYQDIYSFGTDELFAYNRQSGSCIVEKLSTIRKTDAFRPSLNLFDPSSAPSIQNIMNYGANAQFKYINQTVVRGINCDLWRACIYIPSSKSTMIVDYFYSVNTWMTPGFNIQMPIRYHIVGSRPDYNNANIKVNFEHIYEFATYNTVPMHMTVFETPDGVVCPKRKTTKPLPNPAASFHFSAETLDLSGQLKVIAHVKETYDLDNNLVQFDLSASSDSLNPTTRVHDFNTGLAYIVDDVTGGCVVQTISQSGFDVRTVNSSQHVRIRTAKEFFYFDKAQYVYEGTKNVRDILADVWIGQRQSTNDPNINVTWSWYFASSDYTLDKPDVLQFGLPIKMNMHDTMGKVFTYNIYGYDEVQPAIWKYDISQCYNYTEKRDFTFKLPGNFRTIVGNNVELFKYAAIRAVSEAAYINNVQLSPLRISNLQVDYQSNAFILVSFTILDKAPKIGDVANPAQENSLSVVATQISRQINGGQVRIRMKDSNQQVQDMTAQAYSLTNTQHVTKYAFYTKQVQGAVSSSGVSGGAMAGMGVALLVVFFVLGVLATYVYYRRQGGAFVAKKFDNTDITQDDS